MVTGDHLETAKHIAKECGILTNPDQECILGADFREYMNSTKEGAEKTAFMERLRVVARSRPDDKELMVRWYKEQHNGTFLTSLFGRKYPHQNYYLYSRILVNVEQRSVTTQVKLDLQIHERRLT